MKKICEVDQVEFEAKRADAKFCSPRCRKAAARGDILPDTMTDDEVPRLKTLEPEDVPLSAERQQLKLKADRIGISLAEYERRLASFQKMGLAKVEWITTGIPELDEFQKIPRGRVSQIQGPYAVGKTTLALNMLQGLGKQKVFYVDSEASLNPELLMELGLDDKNFTLYNDSAFIEDIYEVVIEAAKNGKYDLIIFDSLAATTFRTEESGDATASNIGQKAKVVNKMMRIMPMYLKNTDTALVIINQEREMIGTYVPMKYTPGGMGVPYAASLILGLKTIPSWRFPKDAKNGAYKGHEIEVTILKSKVSQPHRKKKIKLFYPNPIEEGEEVVPAF